MPSHGFTGKAAPAHPCARGIRASLHIIDVREAVDGLGGVARVDEVTLEVGCGG